MPSEPADRGEAQASDPVRRRLRIALLGVATAIPVLLAGVWIGWGRSQVEMVGTMLFTPTGILWGLLLAWMGWRFVRKGRVGFLLPGFFVVFSLLGNPTLGRTILAAVEARYPPAKLSELERMDYVVILGGGASRSHLDGQAALNGEGQRYFAALRVFRAGKTETLVTTGRRAEDPERDASLIGQEILTEMGVPRERVIRIGGLNTRDEIASIRRELPEESRIGIVTSAFHMGRAMRLAEKAGLEFVPLPTAYRYRDRPWVPADLIPQGSTLDTYALLLKEFLAKPFGR